MAMYRIRAATQVPGLGSTSSRVKGLVGVRMVYRVWGLGCLGTTGFLGLAGYMGFIGFIGSANLRDRRAWGCARGVQRI